MLLNMLVELFSMENWRDLLALIFPMVNSVKPVKPVYKIRVETFRMSVISCTRGTASIDQSKLRVLGYRSSHMLREGR